MKVITGNIILNPETAASALKAGPTEKEYLIIYHLQNNFQFRISEILRLNSDCLIHNYKIVLTISKSNEKFILRDEFIYNVLQEIFSFNSNGSFSVNYHRYSRWLKRKHRSDIYILKGRNNKITHAFRYTEAQRLKAIKQDEKTIKAGLHHNSVRSQSYYLRLLKKELKSKK